MPNGVRFVGVGYRPAASTARPEALATTRRWLARVCWLCGLRSEL